jgi:hypothetical protein
MCERRTPLRDTSLKWIPHRYPSEHSKLARLFGWRTTIQGTADIERSGTHFVSMHYRASLIISARRVVIRVRRVQVMWKVKKWDQRATSFTM